MDNKVEVIGIDHGWSGMKTVHEVFTSGCKEISTEPAFTENLHSGNAANGWYYYTTRFAMPVYDNDVKTKNYNFRLSSGKLYGERKDVPV